MHPYKVAIIQLIPCKLADQADLKVGREHILHSCFIPFTLNRQLCLQLIYRSIDFTYSSIELHKRRWGAVVEFRLQPPSFYITVPDGCTCTEGRTWQIWVTQSRCAPFKLQQLLEVRLCYAPTEPLGQDTAAGRLNFVRGHQIPWVMVFGQPS